MRTPRRQRRRSRAPSSSRPASTRSSTPTTRASVPTGTIGMGRTKSSSSCLSAALRGTGTCAEVPAGPAILRAPPDSTAAAEAVSARAARQEDTTRLARVQAAVLLLRSAMLARRASTRHTRPSASVEPALTASGKAVLGRHLVSIARLAGGDIPGALHLPGIVLRARPVTTRAQDRASALDARLESTISTPRVRFAQAVRRAATRSTQTGCFSHSVLGALVEDSTSTAHVRSAKLAKPVAGAQVRSRERAVPRAQPAPRPCPAARSWRSATADLASGGEETLATTARRANTAH